MRCLWMRMMHTAWLCSECRQQQSHRLCSGSTRQLIQFHDRVSYWIYACVCVCLSVCFSVPYTRPQFSADLNQIWHVASLSPSDGHRPLTSSACARRLALRASSIYAVANGWRSSSGNSELEGGKRENWEPQARGVRREGATLVTYVNMVCYNIGNTVTNTKVRGPAPALKLVRWLSPSAPHLPRFKHLWTARKAFFSAEARVWNSFPSRHYWYFTVQTLHKIAF